MASGMNKKKIANYAKTLALGTVFHTVPQWSVWQMALTCNDLTAAICIMGGKKRKKEKKRERWRGRERNYTIRIATRN